MSGIELLNKMVANNNSKRLMPYSAWTIKDVLIVTIAVFGGSILFYLCTLFLFGDNRTMFRLARYIGSLLMIFLPVAWVKRKYMLSKEILGLTKGNLSYLLSILLGTVIAITYFLLAQITLFGYDLALISFKKTYSFFHLILLPLSISGFATIVLTPIGEEIMNRGFIYGYLRKKTGILGGLFLQAVIFSLLHFNYGYNISLNLMINNFMLGLMFGLLYEKTGSLYTSMICHGMVNYFTIIFLALRG